MLSTQGRIFLEVGLFFDTKTKYMFVSAAPTPDTQPPFFSVYLEPQKMIKDK